MRAINLDQNLTYIKAKRLDKISIRTSGSWSDEEVEEKKHSDQFKKELEKILMEKVQSSTKKKTNGGPIPPPPLFPMINSGKTPENKGGLEMVAFNRWTNDCGLLYPYPSDIKNFWKKMPLNQKEVYYQSNYQHKKSIDSPFDIPKDIFDRQNHYYNPIYNGEHKYDSSQILINYCDYLHEDYNKNYRLDPEDYDADADTNYTDVTDVTDDDTDDDTSDNTNDTNDCFDNDCFDNDCFEDDCFNYHLNDIDDITNNDITNNGITNNGITNNGITHNDIENEYHEGGIGELNRTLDEIIGDQSPNNKYEDIQEINTDLSLCDHIEISKEILTGHLDNDKFTDFFDDVRMPSRFTKDNENTKWDQLFSTADTSKVSLMEDTMVSSTLPVSNQTSTYNPLFVPSPNFIQENIPMYSVNQDVGNSANCLEGFNCPNLLDPSILPIYQPEGLVFPAPSKAKTQEPPKTLNYTPSTESRFYHLSHDEQSQLIKMWEEMLRSNNPNKYTLVNFAMEYYSDPCRSVFQMLKDYGYNNFFFTEEIFKLVTLYY